MCREEGEKFNIWQAWLNLENMYGSPTPDEAVTRLFQKALPYCDAKKLYLALLDILERTNKVSCSPPCAVALQLSLILHWSRQTQLSRFQLYFSSCAAAAAVAAGKADESLFVTTKHQR